MAPAHGPGDRTPVLEWIAGGLGVALVIVIVAVLAREALSADRSAADLTVAALSVQRQTGGFLVKVRASNQSGKAAAQVKVTGQHTPPQGAAETADATFDYVPSGSSRDGGLIFPTDPRTGTLTLSVESYVDP